MVTTKKIAIDYTEKPMKQDLKSFTMKKTEKKTLVQEMKDKKVVRPTEKLAKWQKQAPSCQ